LDALANLNALRTVYNVALKPCQTKCWL